MAKTLGERIQELEMELELFRAKLINLTESAEVERTTPESRVPLVGRALNMPSDIRTGRGASRGSGVVWNDSELKRPPWGSQPNTPTIGYNKHFHSKYAGGALDISALELVEYDFSGPYANYNKHCQQFWTRLPPIKKMDGVEKIGLLDIEFDPELGKWVTGSNTIDVERTKLNQYVIDEEGNKVIKTDSKGQEISAPLHSSDPTKTNVVWDEDAKVWRFYAVYAD